MIDDKKSYTIRVHSSIHKALKCYSDDSDRSMVKSASYLLKKEITPEFKRFPLLDVYSRKKDKICTVIISEKDDSIIDDIILSEEDNYKLNRTDIITSFLLDGLYKEKYLK